MVRKATGASYPAVSDRIVLESRIPCYPIEEQRRIAAILDRADALRAKRSAALAKLDVLAQSIFLDLFGDPATNPKGWPTTTLRTLVDVNPRSAAASVVASASEASTVSFVPMAAVSENTRRVTEYEQRSRESVAKGYTPFRKGDVLVAKITPCFENGKICRVDDMPTENGYGSTEFHVFRAASEEVARYAFALLALPTIRARGARAMKGAAGQKRVPADFFADLLVPRPTQSALREFSRRIAALERERRIGERSEAGLGGLFLSLQDRAFRGAL
jgi:type I restriction enzyme S subunit